MLPYMASFHSMKASNPYCVRQMSEGHRLNLICCTQLFGVFLWRISLHRRAKRRCLSALLSLFRSPSISLRSVFRSAFFTVKWRAFVNTSMAGEISD
jgi:hypothetical protein